MIHQIYYKPEQLPKLYPFAVPYFNRPLTVFFENSVIANLVPKEESDRIAVCSWKLSQKVRKIHPVTQERLSREYQVYSFLTFSYRHRMMAASITWHPGFLETISLLWEKLGLKMPGEAREPLYKNYFSAKTEIYKRYVSEFLQPAIDLIQTDEELHTLMMKDSNYHRMSKEADLPSVKAQLGLDYYPMHPFILERCPALWFTMHNIKITYPIHE